MVVTPLPGRYPADPSPIGTRIAAHVPIVGGDAPADIRACFPDQNRAIAERLKDAQPGPPISTIRTLAQLRAEADELGLTGDLASAYVENEARDDWHAYNAARARQAT
jgi:hypothetical protein